MRAIRHENCSPWRRRHPCLRRSGEGQLNEASRQGCLRSRDFRRKIKTTNHAAEPPGRMLMLSTLRRFELVDERARRARLDDFAVALRDGDYPRVTLLVFRDAEGRSMALPWDSVVDVDWRRRRFLVVDFDTAQSVDAAREREVLLRRDVLGHIRAGDLCSGADVGDATVKIVGRTLVCPRPPGTDS